MAASLISLPCVAAVEQGTASTVVREYDDFFAVLVPMATNICRA